MITNEQITQAVALLKAGKLVAFPTETVYGLGADAENERAINNIFKAKERPFNHPLIVHLPNATHVNKWAVNVSDPALQLMQRFWPGPLTLVLEKHARVLDIVTGGQPNIGLRVPSHPVAQQLLRAFGSGIAAPSANKFTRVSPTFAEAVFDELGTQVDLILDGDLCEVGLESTIIDMTGDAPVLLRPGMISVQEIEATLNCQVQYPAKTSTVRAPGMHALHYAPATQVELVAADKMAERLQFLSPTDLPAVCLSYHSQVQSNLAIDWVCMPKEVAQYARKLYQVLRDLDKKEYTKIFIEAVPNGPEWSAVQDRLLKASGPR